MVVLDAGTRSRPCIPRAQRAHYRSRATADRPHHEASASNPGRADVPAKRGLLHNKLDPTLSVRLHDEALAIEQQERVETRIADQH